MTYRPGQVIPCDNPKAYKPYECVCGGDTWDGTLIPLHTHICRVWNERRKLDWERETGIARHFREQEQMTGIERHALEERE